MDGLKAQHEEDTVCRKNGTLLLKPGKIPRAKHILYKPLTEDLIAEYLVSAYKHPVPQEYLRFLSYSNGASLFQFQFLSRKAAFAGTAITIYGIPRTPPFGRPLDMEEPFDVRIEDLRRHENTPDTYLQIGRFICMTREACQYTAAIFLDCQTQEAIACILDTDTIVEKWDSLDACLTDLFHRAEGYQEAYPFKRKA